jgi:hypothetical protein
MPFFGPFFVAGEQSTAVVVGFVMLASALSVLMAWYLRPWQIFVVAVVFSLASAAFWIASAPVVIWVNLPGPDLW